MNNRDKTISNDGVVAEEFSSSFENALKSVNISPRNLTLGDTTNTAEIAIKKLENYPGVQITKKHTCVDQVFYF